METLFCDRSKSRLPTAKKTSKTADFSAKTTEPLAVQRVTSVQMQTRSKRALALTIGSLALMVPFAQLVRNARGSATHESPQVQVIPSYALREIRPGALVPPTTIPTLMRTQDATLRDWVPPE